MILIIVTSVMKYQKYNVENNNAPELIKWLNAFNKNKNEAAMNFWYEMYQGMQESLREF